MKYLHLLPLLAACHQAPIQSLAQDQGRTREGLTYKVLPGSDTQLHVFLDRHATHVGDNRSEMVECQLDEYMQLQRLHDSGSLDAVFFEGVEQGGDIRDFMDYPLVVPHSKKRADIEQFFDAFHPDVRAFSIINYDSPLLMGGWENEGFSSRDALHGHVKNYSLAKEKVKNGSLSEDSNEYKTAEERFERALDFFGIEVAFRTLHAIENSTKQFEDLEDKSANAYAIFIGAAHMHLIPGFDTLEQYIAHQEDHPTTTFYACDEQFLHSLPEDAPDFFLRVKQSLP